MSKLLNILLGGVLSLPAAMAAQMLPDKPVPQTEPAAVEPTLDFSIFRFSTAPIDSMLRADRPMVRAFPNLELRPPLADMSTREVLIHEHPVLADKIQKTHKQIHNFPVRLGGPRLGSRHH